jgi:hypothetical protein
VARFDKTKPPNTTTKEEHTMAEEMNIADLYKEAEEKASASAPKGEKAEKIRTMVQDIGKKLKQEELVLSAAYQAVKKALGEGEKLDRSYFQSTIERKFETRKDEEGKLIICLNKPKTAASKAASKPDESVKTEAADAKPAKKA